MPQKVAFVPGSSKCVTLALLIAAVILPATLVVGKENKRDAYTGIATKTGPASKRTSVQFDLRIKAYTSDKQMAEFANIWKVKGPNALRRALTGRAMGRINPVGRIGNPIAIARKSQTEHFTVITIVTIWELPFLDFYRDVALDPSFGFLQVRLNENGVGKGQITISGKIRFAQVKNNYEVTVDNKTDIRATNIRPMKWIQGRFKVRPAAFQ